MTRIDFLKEQIIETRAFTNRLISEIPKELWYVIPENSDSNFAWQIGHLMIAQNFHSLIVISGHNEKVYKLIPMNKYIKLFYGMGSRNRSVDEASVSAEKLINEFNTLHEICINNLESLDDEILYQSLEPISFDHPIAKNKYEALSWSFKHEMWHCSEMETIKIALEHQTIWLK